MGTVTWSTNTGRLFCFFLFNGLSRFFPFLLAQGRNQRQWAPYEGSDLKRNAFSFCPLTGMCTVGFRKKSMLSYITLRKFPSVPSLPRIFINRLILSSAFPPPHLFHMVTAFLCLLICWCWDLPWQFSNVETPLHSWNKSNSVMIYFLKYIAVFHSRIVLFKSTSIIESGPRICLPSSVLV